MSQVPRLVPKRWRSRSDRGTAPAPGTVVVPREPCSSRRTGSSAGRSDGHGGRAARETLLAPLGRPRSRRPVGTAAGAALVPERGAGEGRDGCPEDERDEDDQDDPVDSRCPRSASLTRTPRRPSTKRRGLANRAFRRFNRRFFCSVDVNSVAESPARDRRVAIWGHVLPPVLDAGSWWEDGPGCGSPAGVPATRLARGGDLQHNGPEARGGRPGQGSHLATRRDANGRASASVRAPVGRFVDGGRPVKTR